jgi:glycosyltransferase involved in cell wall biosynthesis
MSVHTVLISPVAPTGGFGGGERTRSIIDALRADGPVSTLLVQLPNVILHATPADTVAHLFSSLPPSKVRWQTETLAFRSVVPHRGIADALRGIDRKQRIDRVFCRYHWGLLAHPWRVAPTWVDIDGIPTDGQDYRLGGLKRHAESWGLRRLLSRCDRLFATKASDLRRLKHPHGQVLPCVSTAVMKQPPSPTDGSMLFVGSRHFKPNAEALDFLLQQVMPLIRARAPHARLRIVGKGNSTLPAAPGVSIADFVDDLQAEYRTAAFCLAPVTSGGGSSVKMAEAATAGRAQVATPHAAHGFEGILREGLELFIGDTAASFAEACVRLLEDHQTRARMEAAAATRAEACLSQAAITDILIGGRR